MTLGQFATAVGATPRWVLNARAVLGRAVRYTEPVARRLFVARVLHVTTGMPLRAAWPIAARAVAAWPGRTQFTWDPSGNGITLALDMERVLSTYATNLSLSREWYAEKARGRKPKRRRDAVAYAREFGVDMTLVDEMLKRTPAERLERLYEDAEFVKRIRRVAEP